MGLKVSGVGSRVSGFGFRVSGLGFRVQSLEFRDKVLGFRRHPPLERAGPRVSLDLTEYIHQPVVKSQLPHKIVNSLFTITHQNTKLTVFRGS